MAEQGVPGCRQEVERKQSGQWLHLAKQAGISPELKKQATANVQQIVNDSDVYRRVSWNLKRLFESASSRTSTKPHGSAAKRRLRAGVRTKCEEGGMGELRTCTRALMLSPAGHTAARTRPQATPAP
jgi:hypothetical protein